MKTKATVRSGFNPATKIPGTHGSKLLIITGVALVIVVGAGYTYYRFRKRKKAQDSSQGKSSRVATKKPSGFRCTHSSYPLSYGSCHPDVAMLQRYLKQRYQAHLGSYGKSGVDGRFGALTKQATLKHLGKSSFTERDMHAIKNASKFMKS